MYIKILHPIKSVGYTRYLSKTLIIIFGKKYSLAIHQ